MAQKTPKIEILGDPNGVKITNFALYSNLTVLLTSDYDPDINSHCHNTVSKGFMYIRGVGGMVVYPKDQISAPK